MPVEKTRNGGQWTEARYVGFVRSALRAASMRWGPKNEALKAARLSRGMYLCAECKGAVPNSLPGDGKRVKNVYVDHIDPVVEPEVGFVSWDTFIERLFIEKDGFQILCGACHKAKTAEERLRRRK